MSASLEMNVAVPPRHAGFVSGVGEGYPGQHNVMPRAPACPRAPYGVVVSLHGVPQNLGALLFAWVSCFYAIRGG
jgi:hypothetical protein